MKEKYMNLAIKEAEKALKSGEMPVGAVVVYNDEIIAKAYNQKEKTKNAIMHAEIIAIQKACKKIKNWRLEKCELYVTLEPCTMCMGAIIESRIKKIYCGMRNNKSKNINDQIIENEKIQLEYNVLNQKIENQIKNFFDEIRKK